MTVCEIEAQKVEVITSRGDKWLGGKDFDSELVNIMNNKYKEATGEGLDLANKKLEYMILKNPDQWIWTHDRWK